MIGGRLFESPSSRTNRKNNSVNAPERQHCPQKTHQIRKEGLIPDTTVFSGHAAVLALEVLFRVTAVTAGRYNPLMNKQLLPPAFEKMMISGWGYCCLESPYFFIPLWVCHNRLFAYIQIIRPWLNFLPSARVKGNLTAGALTTDFRIWVQIMMIETQTKQNKDTTLLPSDLITKYLWGTAEHPVWVMIYLMGGIQKTVTKAGCL